MATFFKALLGLLLFVVCGAVVAIFVLNQKSDGESMLDTAKGLANMSDDTPQLKTWTASNGKTLEASLKSYNAFDVVLQPAAGNPRTIARKLLTAEDREYLLEFPDLKNNSIAQFAPKVKISTTSAKSAFDRDQKPGDQMKVVVFNEEEYPVEDVSIMWVWSAGGSETLYGAEIATTNLPSRKTISLTTKNTKRPKGAEGGNFQNGLIVQVFAENTLIGRYTTHRSLGQIASDSRLKARVKPKKVSASRIQASLGS